MVIVLESLFSSYFITHTHHQFVADSHNNERKCQVNCLVIGLKNFSPCDEEYCKRADSGYSNGSC